MTDLIVHGIHLRANERGYYCLDQILDHGRAAGWGGRNQRPRHFLRARPGRPWVDALERLGRTPLDPVPDPDGRVWACPELCSNYLWWLKPLLMLRDIDAGNMQRLVRDAFRGAA